MAYFEEIKSIVGNHVNFLETLINLNLDKVDDKVKKHLETSKQMEMSLDVEEPKKLKVLTEYLANESRNFGWSFSETENETLCENSFWEMQNKIKNLVGGMTLNERLYYFGYLEEFEKIPLNHKSDRDRILHKLFLGEQ